MSHNEPNVANREPQARLNKSSELKSPTVAEVLPIDGMSNAFSVQEVDAKEVVNGETLSTALPEGGSMQGPSKIPTKDDVVLTAPDIEHIVSTGVAQDETLSTEMLRELVARARQVTGQAREALPPGFDTGPSQENLVEAPPSQSAGSSDAREASNATKTIPEPAITIIDSSGNVAKEDAADSDQDSSDPSDSDSSSSSSSSSSSEDEEEGNGVADTAGVEDDDEDGGGAGASSAPATKNEVLVPDVDLPPMQELNEADKATMKRLGRLHSIVDSVVVIEQEVHKKMDEQTSKAGTLPVDSTGRRGEGEGEYSVVDTGSLLCFEDGTVLGLVFETFGSIHSPMYSIRFASASAIDKQVVHIGRPVFYLPGQSTYVMTRQLRAMKGSDASNIYDEEVAEDELDYSDDEAEAEAKRRAKALRSGRTDESGNPLPNANNRANKRQKQSNGPVHSQQQRPVQKQSLPPNLLSQRNGVRPSGRASLPSKPVKGLPARPTFDHDGVASFPTPRQVLSYGEADAADGNRVGHRRLSSASISSLPPKPVSFVSATPQTHRRQPTLPSVSPPQAQGHGSMTASPGSYYVPPTSYHANGAAGWYGPGAPAVAAGSAPHAPAYGVQHDSTGQGHYNPQFAAYWQHQQQAPWYGGAPFHHSQHAHPSPQPHHHQVQHQVTAATQPHRPQQQPYAHPQPEHTQSSGQWNGYQYPAQYQSYNTPQGAYPATPSAQNAATFPQQNTPYGGYPAETTPITYSGYGYGPAGPKPDSYDPHSPSIRKSPES